MNIMSFAVTKFHDGCQMNRLTLNLSKRKIMLFSRLKGARLSSFMNEIDIQINLVQLDTAKSYKYLGIHLDSVLKFTGHI